MRSLLFFAIALVVTATAIPLNAVPGVARVANGEFAVEEPRAMTRDQSREMRPRGDAADAQTMHPPGDGISQGRRTL
ncbi:hypothetical protein FB451DRAFT_1434558 [Mycena latifolia]|nr:hypothetical protein FB451DRAFT_1434558 [Mycena latifolia]